MSSHAVFFAGISCRAGLVRPAKAARGAAASRLKPFVESQKPLRLQRIVQASAESEVETETASSSEQQADANNGQLMPMADSLIERAKEVAASGVVDDAFKSSFVDELAAELDILTQRAKQAEEMAAQMEQSLTDARDKFLRLNADFDNFRKRTSGERDQLKSAVKGDTIMQLVPLIDNFELAKSQLKVESEGEKKVDAAYQGLYKQMVEIFRGLGVEAVPGVGEPFDPNVHDAIMREPNEEVPDGTVLEEFRKGFRLGETLLRPAMVKVSFSDAPAAPPAQQQESEGEQQQSEQQ